MHGWFPGKVFHGFPTFACFSYVFLCSPLAFTCFSYALAWRFLCYPMFFLHLADDLSMCVRCFSFVVAWLVAYLSYVVLVLSICCSYVFRMFLVWLRMFWLCFLFPYVFCLFFPYVLSVVHMFFPSTSFHFACVFRCVEYALPFRMFFICVSVPMLFP